MQRKNVNILTGESRPAAFDIRTNYGAGRNQIRSYWLPRCLSAWLSKQVFVA